MRPAPLTLPDLVRAELYQALGRALSAGLAATRALDALRGICDGALDARLKRASIAVGKGTALSRALHQQGLVSAADHPLLAAAESTGTVDGVCLRLAERYTRAGVRWRRLEGKLMLPVAVLVVGIIVLPLPALAAGRLAVLGYIWRVGTMLTLLAMVAKLASMVVRHWRAYGTPGWLTLTARLVPGTATLSALHQRADACERLAMALACGLPAADALDAMRRAEGNPVRRADLARAHVTLGDGAGVADALERSGLLDSSAYAIVSAGEGAGRLEETLGRVAEHCHDTLDDWYKLLAQWIPVVLYLAVAGAVAVGMLS